MIRLDKVSRRYAKAIADFFGDEAKIRAAIGEFTEFAQIMDKNPELHQVLSSEVFGEKEREGVIEDLASRLKLSADTKKILLVLSNMRRLGQLLGITNRLHQLLLESAGTVPIEVNAAVALTAEEKEKVERRFAKMLGKKVAADYTVDASLIGGLRVTASGRTYDGSLAGGLSNIEEQLVGGRL